MSSNLKDILNGNFSGQSAIEYLMTYGWMLLVVAVTGSAIFAVAGDQSVESSSGFNGEDIQINDFGVSNNGFQIELQSSSVEEIEGANISIVDSETGETVYSNQEYNLPQGDTEIATFSDVGSSENSNIYDVIIEYDTGNLENIVVRGSMTGYFDVNGSIKEDSGSGGNTVSSPSIETISAVKINSDNATLRGNVTDTGGEIPETSFNYGKTPSTSNSISAETNDGVFSENITGLDPGETYYFSAEASNSEGSAQGSVLEFDTDSIISETAAIRWKMNSGSGNTINESLNGYDGEINGPSWVEGNWKGGYAIQADGQDDYIDIGTLGSWGSSLDTNYATAYTIKTSDTGAVWSTYEGTGEVMWGSTVLGDGSLEFDQREGPGSAANRVTIATDTSFNDGAKHRVVWNKVTQDPNNWEVYVNGSQVSFTVTKNQGSPSDMNDFTDPIPMFNSQSEGSVNDQHLSGVLDDVIFYQSDLTQEEIDNDFQTQPWS